MFREKRFFAKLVLWVLVGMLAVGVLITTIPSLPWVNTKSVPDGARQPAPEQQEPQTQLDQLQTLIEQYKKMNAEHPNDTNVLTGYARVEAELGRLYMMEGQQAKGQEVLRQSAGRYRQVLAIQEDMALRLELAGVYHLLGSYDQAEEQLQTVLRKEPRNLQAKARLGLLYESRQDWKRATEIWQDLSKEPDPQTKEFAQERLRLIKDKVK